MLALRTSRPTRPGRARAGWVGVFAMLMMFIGPLLSQTLPASATMNATMPMPAGMLMMDGEGHGEHDAGLHPLWEKCGYCSLFLHTPALPPAAVFVAADRPISGPGHCQRTAAGHAAIAVFPSARPRAPPVLRHA
jgi:hypothetical protein